MPRQFFDPFAHRLELVKNEISLSYCQDKLGDLWYVVHYDESGWVRFEKRQSAIDFINSNFR